jgi:putative copper export protein
MDTLQVILRVLHIVFGTAWAGTIFFTTLFLEPRLKRLGPGIQNPVMGALMPVLTPAMMLSSIMVLGTGIALTLKLRWGMLDLLLSTAWGWAMVLSLVLTVAAMVIGFGIMSPTGMKMEKLGKSMAVAHPHPKRPSNWGSSAAG